MSEKDNKSERTFKGHSIICYPKEYTVLDLETTGLSPDYDDIIEVGAIKVSDGKIVDTFQSLINPGYKIDSFITELTGITNDMLSAAPSIDTVLPIVDKFVGDSIIVGHNVNFDVNFLYDNYMSILSKPFTNDFVDTMRIARKLFADKHHHRLNDIIDYLDVDADNQHRALADCESTYKCYIKMYQLIIDKYGSDDNFVEEFKNSNKYSVSKLSTTNTVFDETHPLYNKECVFTGVLDKLSRKDAAQLVYDIGGRCADNVTKTTDFLILGNNDYCKSIKDGKSNKHKKAEKYKLNGQDIEIIPESVFYDIIGFNER